MKNKALLRAHIEDLSPEEIVSHIREFCDKYLTSDEYRIFFEIVFPKMGEQDRRELGELIITSKNKNEVRNVILQKSLSKLDPNINVEDVLAHISGALDIYNELSPKEIKRSVRLLRKLINHNPILEFQLLEAYNKSINGELDEIYLLNRSIESTPVHAGNLLGGFDYLWTNFKPEVLTFTFSLFTLLFLTTRDPAATFALDTTGQYIDNIIGLSLAISGILTVLLFAVRKDHPFVSDYEESKKDIFKKNEERRETQLEKLSEYVRRILLELDRDSREKKVEENLVSDGLGTETESAPNDKPDIGPLYLQSRES